MEKLADIRLFQGRVLRLGQDQNKQIRRPGLHQVEELEVLVHDIGQGLEVVLTGGLVLRAANVLELHAVPPPARLVQVHPGQGLEGQIVHAGEKPVDLLLFALLPLFGPEALAEKSDLVLLDAVLQGGVVNADQEAEVLIARLRQGVLHHIGEDHLPLPGPQVPEGGLIGSLPLHLGAQVLPVGAPPVALTDVLQVQGLPLQAPPGQGPEGPDGIVLLQGPPLIAHGGGQPHDAVQ